MNKFSLLTGTFTLCLVLAVSCDKDKGKKPTTPTTTTTTGTTVNKCDTVTYAKHIDPIIKANCAINGCHNSTAAGGTIFSDYNDVKAKADGGRIKARVLDGTGGFMPQGMPNGLPDAQKELIKCWLDKGAPNN